MFLERDGKVDIELGLSWDPESGVVDHKHPVLDRLNESVGAYAMAIPQLMVAYNVRHNFPDFDYPEPILPAPETRRKAGAIVNALLSPGYFAASYIIVRVGIDTVTNIVNVNPYLVPGR